MFFLGNWRLPTPSERMKQYGTEVQYKDWIKKGTNSYFSEGGYNYLGLPDSSHSTLSKTKDQELKLTALDHRHAGKQKEFEPGTKIDAAELVLICTSTKKNLGKGTASVLMDFAMLEFGSKQDMLIEQAGFISQMENYAKSISVYIHKGFVPFLALTGNSKDAKSNHIFVAGEDKGNLAIITLYRERTDPSPAFHTFVREHESKYEEKKTSNKKSSKKVSSKKKSSKKTSIPSKKQMSDDLSDLLQMEEEFEPEIRLNKSNKKKSLKKKSKPSKRQASDDVFQGLEDVTDLQGMDDKELEPEQKSSKKKSSKKKSSKKTSKANEMTEQKEEEKEQKKSSKKASKKHHKKKKSKRKHGFDHTRTGEKRPRFMRKSKKRSDRPHR